MLRNKTFELVFTISILVGIRKWPLRYCHVRCFATVEFLSDSNE